jgi:quercetin dioxygenase-like cupin family protein
MEIMREGSQLSQRGVPADHFTGCVRIDPLFQSDDPARLSVASVTFEPGARTAWHTHPCGQVLVITSGSGLAQSEGSHIHEIYAGDVVYIPPGERHWHGASPVAAMSHIAIEEPAGHDLVQWMEKVTDEQYGELQALID